MKKVGLVFIECNYKCSSYGAFCGIHILDHTLFLLNNLFKNIIKSPE